MKVSILVPVYNAEQFIERCAEALFNQTYKDIEYIFVDDCSKDNSVQKLQLTMKKHIDKNPYVSIIRNNRNEGIAYTRNVLLDNATGDYILFVDSDDFISTDAVEKLASIASSTYADIVRQNYYEIKDGEKSLCNINENCNSKEDIMKNTITGSDFVDAIWLLFIKRETIEKNSLRFVKNINFCEDWIMTIKLLYFSNNVKCIHDAYYYYNKSNTASLTSQRLYAHTEGLKAIEHIYTFLKDKDIFEKYKDCFYTRTLKWKQCLLIYKEMLDINKYISFFPESNSYWRQLGHGRRERLLFWLAEHKLSKIISLLYKIK